MEGKKTGHEANKKLIVEKKIVNEMDGRREVDTIYVNVECQNQQ